MTAGRRGWGATAALIIYTALAMQPAAAVDFRNYKKARAARSAEERAPAEAPAAEAAHGPRELQGSCGSGECLVLAVEALCARF